MYAASPVATHYRASIHLPNEGVACIRFETVQVGDNNKYVLSGTEWRPTKVEAIQVLKDRLANEAFRCGDKLPGLACSWLSGPQGKKAMFEALKRVEPDRDPLQEYPPTVKPRRRGGGSRYRKKT